MSSSPISHSYGTRQAGARRAAESADRVGVSDLGAELPQKEREDVQEVKQDLRVGGEGGRLLEGDEAAESGGEENSDRDEALDDRSRGSSAATEGSAPPLDFSSALFLGWGHCRASILITTRGGIRIPCVCGKKIQDCRQHAPQRRRGKSPFPVGYYMPMTDRSAGFLGHGIRDQYCSEAQYQAHRNAENEEMARLVREQETGAKRGAFSGGDRGVRWEEEEIIFEREGGDPEVQVGGHRAGDDALGEDGTDKPVYFGAQLRSGERFVAEDPEDFQEVLPEGADLRFQIGFNSRREALEWHRTGSLGRSQFSANEATPPAVKARGAHGEDRRKNPGGRSRVHGSSESDVLPTSRGAGPKGANPARPHSEPERSVSVPRAPAGTRKALSRSLGRSSSPRRAALRSGKSDSSGFSRRARGGSGGPGSGGSSSPSSSSFSETSDDGESVPSSAGQDRDSANGDDSLSDDSSISSADSGLGGGRRSHGKGSSRRRRSHRKTSSRGRKRHSGRKSRRQERDRRARGRSKVFDGTDESVGDPARAFGMDIEGRKIDAAIAPPDLSSKDFDALYDTALDVAALPGTLKSSTYKPPEGLTMDGLGSLVNTWTSGRTKYTTFKTAWDSEHNHGLGRISDKATLLKAAQKLHDDRKDNLKPTSQRVNILLLERHYTSAAVKRSAIRRHPDFGTLVLRSLLGSAGYSPPEGY